MNTLMFSPQPSWAIVIIAGGALLVFVAWRLLAAIITRTSIAPWALRLLGVLGVAIVLLRPSIPGPSETGGQERSDLDVMLVVDSTTSMAAQDWAGNRPRLEGVREDAEAIADAHIGARFAVVQFDQIASQRLPFIYDASALLASIESIRTEPSIRSSGSDISEAVPLLEEVLDDWRTENPDRRLVLYYMGDGEQTSETAPQSFDAIREYLSAGAVFGYGTSQGARMQEWLPFEDEPGGFVFDPLTGDDAVSVIDEANLRTIADELGVAYSTRSAGAEAPVADITGNVTSSFQVGDELATRLELYWIGALVVFGVLVIEIVRLMPSLSRLRAEEVR